MTTTTATKRRKARDPRKAGRETPRRGGDYGARRRDRERRRGAREPRRLRAAAARGAQRVVRVGQVHRVRDGPGRPRRGARGRRARALDDRLPRGGRAAQRLVGLPQPRAPVRRPRVARDAHPARQAQPRPSVQQRHPPKHQERASRWPRSPCSRSRRAVRRELGRGLGRAVAPHCGATTTPRRARRCSARCAPRCPRAARRRDGALGSASTARIPRARAHRARGRRRGARRLDVWTLFIDKETPGGHVDQARALLQRLASLTVSARARARARRQARAVYIACLPPRRWRRWRARQALDASNEGDLQALARFRAQARMGPTGRPSRQSAHGTQAERVTGVSFGFRPGVIWRWYWRCAARRQFRTRTRGTRAACFLERLCLRSSTSSPPQWLRPTARRTAPAPPPRHLGVFFRPRRSRRRTSRPGARRSVAGRVVATRPAPARGLAR